MARIIFQCSKFIKFLLQFLEISILKMVRIIFLRLSNRYFKTLEIFKTIIQILSIKLFSNIYLIFSICCSAGKHGVGE